MPTAPPLLEIRDLTRHRDGRAALDAINLSVRRGDILGLMGASGAGKSALLAVAGGHFLSRAHPADRGRLLWNGQDVTGLNLRTARALGIALVPQDPALPEQLTVAEAVALGHEPLRSGFRVDRPAMARRAADWLGRLGAAIDPSARLGTLTPAARQQVALARALATAPRLLLLDAPTAALRPQDTDGLFEALGDLQAQGTAIVYASDRFGEIEALATRVAVLRDGQLSGELARHELNPRTLGAHMIGGEFDLPLKELIEPGLERLRVDALRTTRFPATAVSFSLREGEIVGMAGLAGSGRTALLRTLFGLDRALGGSIVVNETSVEPLTPRTAAAAGMAWVPADAGRAGTAPAPTLREWLTLPGLRPLAPAGVVRHATVDRLAAMLNEHLSITDGPLDQAPDQLTPGQRRKAALAAWLPARPSVVLLDEPTRGVDLPARLALYEAMERLAERGAAVLFASPDTDELLRVADRLLVFREGALAGTLNRDDDFTERGIMRLAAGLAP